MVFPMARTQIPATGGALPAVRCAATNNLPFADADQVANFATCSALPLSALITDPFVRRAFERAEREDGTAPALMPAGPRKPLQGGAEATTVIKMTSCPLDRELSDA
jgi:hypothetical protein